MLTLILSPAGRGKTSYIYGRIRDSREKTVLIVPEQYSHDAERILAELGDDVCLYAEVLSFTRLSNRVFSETGGMADKILDKGGRILTMSLAVSSLSDELKYYNVGGRRPDFCRSLVAAYDEIRSANAGSSELYRASLNENAGSLGDKLHDLSLIFEMYDAIKERCGCDTHDRLEKLAADIGKSSVGDTGHIYIDGFTDFTAQEFRVVTELLKKNADMTIAFTCGEDEDELLFRVPLKTVTRLTSAAKLMNIDVNIIRPEKQVSGKPSDLMFCCEHLFEGSPEHYGEAAENISVLSPATLYDECSFAAAKILELVRGGARFRDIAVVSPMWDSYESVIRGVFAKYGVPIDITERSDIMEKPVTAMLASALDIISGGWEYDSVFKYLKTGLAGVPREMCDALENYAITWSLRGEKIWCGGDFEMSPNGYADSLTDAEETELFNINNARRMFTAPLIKLHNALRVSETATGKVRAVYEFMEDVGLYGSIEKRRLKLLKDGDRALANEYSQLWAILVNAMQQFADILGDTHIDTDEFIRLLKLVLSQYDVGTIPSRVDSVHAGDMKRIRPRGIKHLIILGATDSAIPAKEQENGVFSSDERDRLRRLGIELIDSREDTLSRELYAVYASFTLPSETLTVTYPQSERPSYIVTRLLSFFGAENTAPTPEYMYTAALAPCFEYAVSGTDAASGAAREYFSARDDYRDALDAAKRAGSVPRGRLTRIAADSLYGREINISASRIDRFYSCKYSFFLRYGLRLRARKKVGLDPIEAGNFMHYVLEHSVKEIESRGGFSEIRDEDVRDIVPICTDEYAADKLGGLGNKTGRFRYLYERMSATAADVVLELADEMRRSLFRPLDFELAFSRNGVMAPIRINYKDGTVTINGKVDRVDGWVKGDDLYLRVIDYKTGSKALSLSDVWYGLGMQMLIYLFALEKDGAERYGKNIVPAGVLYSPAKDVIISCENDLDDETLQKQIYKKLEHSGVILDDRDVVDAMERDGKLLPVKFSKDGDISGDSLVSLDRLGKLSRLVRRRIIEMSKELRDGDITADPYFDGQQNSACAMCEYFNECRFGECPDDRRRFLKKLKPDEVWEKIEGDDFGTDD